MSADPTAPIPSAPAESPTLRRIHALKGPLLFALTLLLGVVGGWFIHKLVDMEQVPWQAMVQTLIILVVLMVVAALAARVIFKTVIAGSMDAVQTGLSKAADTIRQSPTALTTPAFWLDEVWPTLREAKSVAFAWIGVYTTMAAVVALTALLCQTGSLTVAYLGDDGKPIKEPRSPERGFVLRSLVAAWIDITGLIDQRADFSYAEAENAVLDDFRLEPTPIAASSEPGGRGLILSYAQLEGVSFRGSRLGEARY